MTDKTVAFAGQDLAAVADIVKKHTLGKIDQVEIDGHKVDIYIAPDGKLASIKAFADAYRKEPERRKGTATLTDLGSFIAHVTRFMDEDSAIFADHDPQHPSVTAVLDYHRKGHDGKPRFGQHRASYAFGLSDEWKAWTAQDEQAMNQGDFARWVENHIADVTTADDVGEATKRDMDLLLTVFASPTKLLELSRGLSIRQKSDVANHQVLASGEVRIDYRTEHTDERGQPITVPGAFLINIPIFRGDAAYKIPVRLRYRLEGPRLNWFFELFQSERRFRHAFDTALNKVREETKLPVLFGAPES